MFKSLYSPITHYPFHHFLPNYIQYHVFSSLKVVQNPTYICNILQILQSHSDIERSFPIFPIGPSLTFSARSIKRWSGLKHFARFSPSIVTTLHRFFKLLSPNPYPTLLRNPTSVKKWLVSIPQPNNQQRYGINFNTFTINLQHWTINSPIFHAERILDLKTYFHVVGFGFKRCTPETLLRNRLLCAFCRAVLEWCRRMGSNG